MDFVNDLELALKDLQCQPSLYRPTAFWAQAVTQIADSLLCHGVEAFRQNPQCMAYFVPGYGPVARGINSQQADFFRKAFRQAECSSAKGLAAIEQFLDGEAHALADYRVLKAADNPVRAPRLDLFSESCVGHPDKQHVFEGRRYSRSSLNYLLGVAMLKQYLAHHLPDQPFPRCVLEIGGGFGSLGEVLSQSQLGQYRYVNVDLPPTGIVAEWYLRQVLRDPTIVGYSQTRALDNIPIEALPATSVLMPWQLPRLVGKVDLFVNFISFQEMEPPVVANYLDLVSRLQPDWILLRNLKEGKQKRASPEQCGVDEPILGDDYQELLPDYFLVQRGAIPFGYITVDGFHSELLLFQRNEMLPGA
jgi:putative sugar O-methyltransferase